MKLNKALFSLEGYHLLPNEVEHMFRSHWPPEYYDVEFITLILAATVWLLTHKPPAAMDENWCDSQHIGCHSHMLHHY